jgi:hypothetical protein
MVLKEFQFEFENLSVQVSDMAVLMGFGSSVPEPFPEFTIRGGYRLFDEVEINRDNFSIKIGKEYFLPGKIVINQLKKSTSAALFICTAGKDISIRSKELMNEGLLVEGYVMDVLGSVTVEKAMDKIQESLKEEMKMAGMGISDRYSPGYCNWSVAEQQKLFSLFPEKFCGVSLSESSLMNPIKSVSGIIGIGKEMKQKGYLCNWCNDENCIYRRIKRKAGKKTD